MILTAPDCNQKLLQDASSSPYTITLTASSEQPTWWPAADAVLNTLPHGSSNGGWAAASGGPPNVWIQVQSSQSMVIGITK